MVLQHEWSYKIMNSFYDGYSGDAFILMVRRLYLSFFFFCIPPPFPEKRLQCIYVYMCVGGGQGKTWGGALCNYFSCI